MTESFGKVSKHGAVDPIGIWIHDEETDRWFPAMRDLITGAIIIIDSFHHEIHEGETFIVSHFVASINNNANIILHLTPGTHFDHLTFNGTCGGDALLEVFENPNVDPDGAAEDEINMKFTSAEVADTVVVSDPTVNADGTFKFECFLPGGTGGNAQGGILGLRANSEFILDPGNTYMVRLTNISGNAKPVCLIVQWYEESDN